MSRSTDLAFVVYSARHCNKTDCRKCRARSRWMRRKAWRSANAWTVAAAAGRGDAR